MKRAALIAVIGVYGFLFVRFVLTSFKSIKSVGEPEVKTEGRKTVTDKLQFPPAASSGDRTSETILGLSEVPQPHDVVMSLHSPSEFPELSEDFRKLLGSRGCEIPEYVAPAFVEKPPATVISGDFARSGQTDWAVVCEKDGESSIVISWGKPTDCDSELATAVNDYYIEGDGSPNGTVWKFKRGISPFPSEALLDQIKSLQGSEAGGGNWVAAPPPDYRVGPPPPEYPNLSHSAIGDYGRHDDTYFWYCSEGHWYIYSVSAE